MICLSCRERRHGECRGGSWCDCQHQPGRRPATGPETGTDADSEAPGDTAVPGEPEVNWKRQG